MNTLNNLIITKIVDISWITLSLTIILFVITLGRELATWFSRRGDSKAVNTEAQILLRIIYRQDCDLKMVQQDLT
ncbi:hypothetical protein PYW08_001263 [Mythimna loreyi]|uniref:Uncharacterized protein n=1 Tax=Mythimna loreyi TaxID=667449 RepID=A0ACC2R2L0_9NEOP|nr:hypothetical protein PYW08_001263 [Mythimna loreyi]